MTTTPTKRPANSGVSVGNVPALAVTRFFRTMLPAIASSGTIIKKRPISIEIPSVVFQYGVFAEIPANALPLLPVVES